MQGSSDEARLAEFLPWAKETYLRALKENHEQRITFTQMEGRVIEVARSIEAVDVVRALATLIAARGAPCFIRSDHGPEFIAGTVRAYLQETGAQTLFIAPGSPWENA